MRSRHVAADRGTQKTNAGTHRHVDGEKPHAAGPHGPRARHDGFRDALSVGWGEEGGWKVMDERDASAVAQGDGGRIGSIQYRPTGIDGAVRATRYPKIDALPRAARPPPTSRHSINRLRLRSRSSAHVPGRGDERTTPSRRQPLGSSRPRPCS